MYGLVISTTVPGGGDIFGILGDGDCDRDISEMIGEEIQRENNGCHLECQRVSEVVG